MKKKFHLDINKQKQWLGRAHMWVHGCVFEWVSEGIANTTHITQQAEVFVWKLAKMFFMLIIRCYSIHCILSGYWEIDHIYTWFHFPCRNRIHGNFPIDLIVMHTHPMCVCVICRVSFVCAFLLVFPWIAFDASNVALCSLCVYLNYISIEAISDQMLSAIMIMNYAAHIKPLSNTGWTHITNNNIPKIYEQ